MEFNSKPSYHLWTYYCSSCAQRVRIAAHHKGIPLIYHYLDMAEDDHESEEYRKINPSGAIPTLVVEDGKGKRFVLTQSTAILEYFEEQFPNQNPLLPPLEQPEKRATVREVQNIITNDIFPPTNSRIARKVKAVRNERDDAISFVHQIMKDGFAAYEAMLEKSGGEYSIGDEVTLADVCLVPQVDQAIFYELDFTPYSRMMAVYNRLMQLDAFKKGSWRSQEDTPAKHHVDEQES